MKEFILCDQRKRILELNAHLLIEGGPGSGKTTIALLKAKSIIEGKFLKPNQKVLFLSFARATISRVEEHAKHLVSSNVLKQVDINTYHGFCWDIIKAHGYLLKPHRGLKLIAPPNLASLLASVPKDEQENFKDQMLERDGIICFDQFSRTAADLFKRSTKLKTVYSDSFPFIIVDEFQDTDSNEWELIKQLGQSSRIIALADRNQRIYDFRGASLNRISEFLETFNAEKFNFANENNRSGPTDIAVFGNDLLSGKNIGSQYNDVVIVKYANNFYEPRLILKSTLSKCISRLKQKHDWSIAILVRSKAETLTLSSYLSTASKMPAFFHEVLIDPFGPYLSAEIIAKVLQTSFQSDKEENELIEYVASHILGRKGDGPSQKDRAVASFLEEFIRTKTVRGKNRVLLINEIKAIVKSRKSVQMTGVPEEDWLTVRKMFQTSTHEVLYAIC